MTLLQTSGVISFTPSILYNIAGFISLVVALVGAFFKLQNRQDLLQQEYGTMKEYIQKIEERANQDYSKIENKISELENRIETRHKELTEKIDKLPGDLAQIFKNVNLK